MTFDTIEWTSRALTALRRLGAHRSRPMPIDVVNSQAQLEDALSRSTPVVVRLDLADHFDLQRTAELVPEQVPVATGDYEHSYDTSLELMRYRDYLQLLARAETEDGPPPEQAPPYLRAARFGGGFDLLARTPRRLGLSELFGAEVCEQPLLWAGLQRSASVAHVDIFDNLAIGLRGTKVFRLWHASDLGLDDYRPGCPRGRFWTCHGQLPPPHATVELRPNTGLVLPAGWIHEVRATGVTVMVNFFSTGCEPRSFTALRRAAAS